MRVRAAVSALAVLLSVAVAISATSATGTAHAATAAPSRQASHATVKVIVRPVTAAGHAHAGFTVAGEPTGQLDCSSPAASPGAVSPNIPECSPSAEYAIACWKSASPAHALCMRNVRGHKLVNIPDTGTFAHVATPDPNAPLALTLGDGDHCTIRDGGAWSTLLSHPQWNGEYSCGHDGVVWAAPKSNHYGVNESKPRWTVHTGSASGTESLVVRRVVKAFFVGTHR